MEASPRRYPRRFLTRPGGLTLRVQKCAVGRSQDVSSSVPARTRRKPSSELDAPQTQEPHSGQTHRVTTPPLSAVRWIARGSIPAMRKATSVTTIAIENALSLSAGSQHSDMCKPTASTRSRSSRSYQTPHRRWENALPIAKAARPGQPRRPPAGWGIERKKASHCRAIEWKVQPGPDPDIKNQTLCWGNRIGL